jgi:RNA polymerase sigma-70 factor (ECF subfamily)
MADDTPRQIVALLPRLRRFGYGLTGSLDEGDDLVQAACERALEHLGQWQAGTRLDSWMFRIMQTIWIDRMRARKRHGEVQDPDLLAAVEGDDGRRIAESRITLKAVRAAIGRLPDEQRAVLMLVAIDGMSYKEAAATLGIPIGTVMSRLARARRHLDADLGGVRDAV